MSDEAENAEASETADTQPPGEVEEHHSAFIYAFCKDLPYIVDSVWRRAEFNFNRLIGYEISTSDAGVTSGALVERTFTRVPQFLFFMITLVFAAYGPTFDAWCSVVGSRGMAITRGVVGVALILFSIGSWSVLGMYGTSRAQKRFVKMKVPEAQKLRRAFVNAVVQATALVVAAAVGRFGYYLFEYRLDDVCRPVPTDAPARYQLGLLLLTLTIAAFFAFKRRKAFTHLAQQVALLFGMLLILWIAIVPKGASEAHQTPYVHTFGVTSLALALLALLSYPLAGWLFGTVSPEQRDLFRKQLSAEELFPGSRDDPVISSRRICAAIFTGVFYHLSEFLLLPSLVGLLVPSHWLLFSTVVSCAVAAWLLMMGNLTARWQAMVSQVRRWFLVGTPLAVSFGVIAIAIARLAKVQYVTTVLDAAPFGVIFVWIVMAYCLLWWFEITINTAVAHELIEIIGSEDDIKNGYVKYQPTCMKERLLKVNRADRYIAVHGAGRFVALGWFLDKTTKEPTLAFQAFDLVELFIRLTPRKLADLGHDLRRRIQLYFLTINALIVGLLWLSSIYYGWGDRHNTVAPVISAHAVAALPQARLPELLLSSHQPFIVAASGGGTRAALFTATALHGLHRLGVDRDIVLLSGVSGGGVAEAYFYTHREALIAPKSEEAWQLFESRMTDPFIGDVLEGAGDWRLWSREPLGQLLVESFERRLFNLAGDAAKIGSSTKLGLILNTTITAHPQEDAALLQGAFTTGSNTPEHCDQNHRPYALTSGGRLIFTNLSEASTFPASTSIPPHGDRLMLPDVGLPYVVVRDTEVPIAAAAALNANFPPVFTNARVDVEYAADPICPTRTYTVTDGGATENLGLLSALYALRSALQTLSAKDLPPIHIVTIEASASAYDYTPDRGVNAATGGSKERLTGGLTQELLDQVQLLGKATGDSAWKLQVHDLALPLAFRSRGGFGTHWMFPKSIVVENPRNPAPLKWYRHLWEEWTAPDPPTAVVDKTQLNLLWSALHNPDLAFCDSAWKDPDERRIYRWICGLDNAGMLRYPEDIQLAQWQELVKSLHEHPPNYRP